MKKNLAKILEEHGVKLNNGGKWTLVTSIIWSSNMLEIIYIYHDRIFYIEDYRAPHIRVEIPLNIISVHPRDKNGRYMKPYYFEHKEEKSL